MSGCERSARLASGAQLSVSVAGIAQVTAAVIVFPSQVAVMTTTPIARPVARPVALTLTIAVFVDDQLTTRPVRMLLLTSYAATVNCCVPLTAKADNVGESVI